MKTAPIDPPESLDPLKRALAKTDKQIFDDDWVAKSLTDPPESKDWIDDLLPIVDTGFGADGSMSRNEARQTITHRIEEAKAESFRLGQLDCQKAGNPTNHKYWNEAVAEEVRKARIDENQRRLDIFVEWENRKLVPGEITAASFGSAGASMTAYSFKHSFEDRISELEATDSPKSSKGSGEHEACRKLAQDTPKEGES